MKLDQPQLILIVLILSALVMLLFFPARALSRPKFKTRALMNASETRIYKHLRSALPSDWSVMAQVSYGAFLQNKSYQRFLSVLSKRADFILLDAALNVQAAVEYHGKGHFGRGSKKRAQVKQSDKIKRQALTEAGLPLIELPHDAKARDIATALNPILESAALADRPAPALPSEATDSAFDEISPPTPAFLSERDQE